MWGICSTHLPFLIIIIIILLTALYSVFTDFFSLVTAAAWILNHQMLSPKDITVQLSNTQYKVIIVFWCTKTGKPLKNTLVHHLL